MKNHETTDTRGDKGTLLMSAGEIINHGLPAQGYCFILGNLSFHTFLWHYQPVLFREDQREPSVTVRPARRLT
jgi:hypothetical protein